MQNYLSLRLSHFKLFATMATYRNNAESQHKFVPRLPASRLTAVWACHASIPRSEPAGITRPMYTRPGIVIPRENEAAGFEVLLQFHQEVERDVIRHTERRFDSPDRTVRYLGFFSELVN